MRPLLRLLPYLKPHFWLILASAVLAIPVAALRVGPVPLVKYVLDNLEQGANPKVLIWFPIAILAVYGANFVVRFLHYYLIRIVVARVNRQVKNDLYEHLLGLSSDYFTAQSTGTLISRVGVDTNYVDHAISNINTIVREPLTFLFLFGYVISVDWKLTLITLIIFPPLAWVFAASGRNFKRYVGRLQEENGRLYSVVQETFTGIRVIHSFTLEKYVRRKFYERSNLYTRIHLKIAALEEATHPLVEFLMAIIVAVVIFYGGRQVLQGAMTRGDLIAFFAAFGLMVNPLRTLNELNIKLHQAAAGVQRIFDVFDWHSHIKSPEKPVRLARFEKAIEVRDVHFAYPDSPQRSVLKGVSFTLHRGQVVALVGASGAGKSSMVNLLPRVYDVTSGQILVDGHDVRELDLRSLRRMIAVVSQDVFLFNDTIEQNIRCGRLSATREEIREAARRAFALDFIEALPEGFQTVIGDRGQKLSGGERQRLSIARAFLRESPILILDEATSSLDTASERAVQAALEELMQNKTTLVIAHRLSTIRHADHILVLRDGEVVERGRHEELIARAGEYARFHQP